VGLKALGCFRDVAELSAIALGKLRHGFAHQATAKQNKSQTTAAQLKLFVFPELSFRV